MKDILNKYHQAKLKSKTFMKGGQITEYLNALLEVQKYKQLLLAIKAN